VRGDLRSCPRARTYPIGPNVFLHPGPGLSYPSWPSPPGLALFRSTTVESVRVEGVPFPLPPRRRHPVGASRLPDYGEGVAAEDELYAKWMEWLKTIAAQTHTLWAYRDYWRGLAEMTQANDEIPPSTFFDALGIWYADEQTVAVRRQLDRDTRSVSLWRLINDIASHPEVMTRDRHVALWRDEQHDERDTEYWQAEANKNYDRFAGAGNDFIDRERTLDDLRRLEQIAEPIKRYVDRRVAHTDEAELTEVPTFAELNAALDELGELLKKYTLLLEAASLADVSPIHQADWQRAFTVPWKKA
jgi:AbiU2